MNLLAALVFLGACAQITPFSKPKTSVQDNNRKEIFSFSDLSGQYKLIKEVGELKKGKSQFVRSRYYSQGTKKDLLEETIVISQKGMIRKGESAKKVFRPQLVKHIVWLEGKEYTALMKLNIGRKSLDVVTQEDKKKKEFLSIKFPDGQNFCFFSQLVECVKEQGFFSQVEKNKSGIFEFYIVWDGYPYFNQQYGLPLELFTKASLSFSELDHQNLWKYQLDFTGQSIFLHLSNNQRPVKLIWVSQGLSQIAYDFLK